MPALSVLLIIIYDNIDFFNISINFLSFFSLYFAILKNFLSLYHSDTDARPYSEVMDFPLFKFILPGNTPPDLHQQKYHTDPQQDVSDSCNTGNCRVHTCGKRSPQYLNYPSHNKHNNSQIQPDMIDSQYCPVFGPVKEKLFSRRTSKRKNTMPRRK